MERNYDNRFELKIKEWFYDKIEDASRCYNTFIDFRRDENGCRKIEDGYITVIVEQQYRETEKAIQVRLQSGECVGSCKGWNTWIPKSVICE